MSSSGSTSEYPTPAQTPPPRSFAVTPNNDDVSRESDDPKDSESAQVSSSVISGEQQKHTRELEAFRREWQAEVTRRRGESHQPVAGPSTLPAPAPRAPVRPQSPPVPPARSRKSLEGDAAHNDDEEYEARPHSPSRTRHLLQMADEQRRVEAEERAEALANGTAAPPSSQPRPPARQRFHNDAPALGSAGTKNQMKAAVKAYATAVENERRGNMDEALVYYRKAFRLDSSADRLYERAFSLLRESENHHSSVANGSAVTPLAPQDESSQAAAERQKDALLASPDVAELVKKAVDFDDVRVAAIEKAKERHRKQQEADKHRVSKSTRGDGQDVEERERPEIETEAADDMRYGLGEEPDELDAIVRNARDEEGNPRDFSRIDFKSRPPAVSITSRARQEAPQQGQPPKDEATDAVEGLTDRLDHAQLDSQGVPDLPPPPIAKLPDELLGYICHLVVEPRGKRAAKIKVPKVEPVNAQTDKDAASHRKGPKQDKSQQPASAQLTTPSTTAASGTKPSLGLGMVLAGPDWQSLESLSLVCWKFRLLTRSHPLWSFILRETYFPPQLPLTLCPSPYVNPRQTFIHHPRLRLTGCYIAACRYSRPGLSVDNAWVRVIHLVEYYRSIRFLPDGRALTLLTTDAPKDTVGRMHLGNREKGFAVGRWQVVWPASEAALRQQRRQRHPTEDGLVDNDDAEDEDDDGVNRKPTHHHHHLPPNLANPHLPRIIISDLCPSTTPSSTSSSSSTSSTTHYSFRMTLTLRSTHRGKWNKLDLEEYVSVNLSSGDVVEVPRQASTRPFYFSRVKAMGV